MKISNYITVRPGQRVPRFARVHTQLGEYIFDNLTRAAYRCDMAMSARYLAAGRWGRSGTLSSDMAATLTHALNGDWAWAEDFLSGAETWVE